MTVETDTTPSTGSCCSPTGSCHDGAADVQIGQADSVTTVYQVKGMTCGHCRGGPCRRRSPGSRASPRSPPSPPPAWSPSRPRAPLAEDAVRAAVDEAGYELLGPAA